MVFGRVERCDYALHSACSVEVAYAAFRKPDFVEICHVAVVAHVWNGSGDVLPYVACHTYYFRCRVHVTDADSFIVFCA